jgi:hypothetical protein
MNEKPHGIGKGPVTRVSLSLPEGTIAAIHARVGKRELSAFVTEVVERELRARILDEYLADHERRNGPASGEARVHARQVFDEALAEDAQGPVAG